MQQCYYSKHHHYETVISSSFLLAIGLLLIAISVRGLGIDHVNFLSYIICLLLGPLICILAITMYAIFTPKYQVLENYIIVSYLGYFKKSYRWSDVSDICVCDVNHAPKNPDQFDIVIRVAVGLDKHGLPFADYSEYPSSSNYWRSMEYNIVHLKNIVLIEYDLERLQQIIDVCDHAIRYSLTTRAQKKLDEFKST